MCMNFTRSQSIILGFLLVIASPILISAYAINIVCHGVSNAPNLTRKAIKEGHKWETLKLRRHRNLDGFTMRGMIYFNHNEIDKAWRVLDKALAIDPNFIPALYLKLNCQAANLFNNNILENENATATLLHLYSLIENKSQNELNFQFFEEKYNFIVPKDEVINNIAKYYFDQKKPDLALSLFQSVIEKYDEKLAINDPFYPVILYNIARCHSALKNKEIALSTVNEAVGKFRSSNTHLQFIIEIIKWRKNYFMKTKQFDYASIDQSVYSYFENYLYGNETKPIREFLVEFPFNFTENSEDTVRFNNIRFLKLDILFDSSNDHLYDNNNNNNDGDNDSNSEKCIQCHPELGLRTSQVYLCEKCASEFDSVN